MPENPMICTRRRCLIFSDPVGTFAPGKTPKAIQSELLFTIQDQKKATRMRAPKTDTATRQEQIAEAAMEMIASGGLASLSMVGIAERVGMVPSAVYRHYKSKEAVLDAVLHLLRSKLLANVEKVRQDTPGALGRLRALFVLHMTMLAEKPAFPHVVFAQFSQADRPELWQHLRDTMCDYVQQVVRIVEEGQHDEDIRPDVVPKTTAVMFIGLVLPAAMLHRLSGGDFDTSLYTDTAWPAFVRCIGAEQPSERKCTTMTTTMDETTKPD